MSTYYDPYSNMTDVSHRLSNEELSAAIYTAHTMVRGTATSEEIHKMWVAHLQLLLTAQVARSK